MQLDAGSSKDGDPSHLKKQQSDPAYSQLKFGFIQKANVGDDVLVLQDMLDAENILAAQYKVSLLFRNLGNKVHRC